jgi:hypothetical protein
MLKFLSTVFETARCIQNATLQRENVEIQCLVRTTPFQSRLKTISMTQTYLKPVYFVRKWFHGNENILKQSLTFVRLKTKE